jgi:hypothetical protein
MSESVAHVSASELLGGNPPEKKQRPPWPPGEPLKESYSGSGLYRHPVDKAFIKREDAIALGAPAPTVATPQPAPAPQPSPAPEPQPEPRPETAPGPDFSDLPNGDPGGDFAGEQQAQPNLADAVNSHRALGGIFHGTIETMLTMFFGDAFKTNERERNELVEAWAAAFEWWEIRVLNPAERLAAAYGGYMTARAATLISWFKNRSKKRKERAETVNVESEVNAEPDNTAPENN